MNKQLLLVAKIAGVLFAIVVIITTTVAVYGTVQESNAPSSQAPTIYNGPGANAVCKDGYYSYSTHRSGTCAGHSGVKEWL